MAASSSSSSLPAAATSGDGVRRRGVPEVDDDAAIGACSPAEADLPDEALEEGFEDEAAAAAPAAEEG